MAHGYILLEIVRDIAVTKTDRRHYLSHMFERVMSRWEKSGPLDREAHPVSAEVRWTFENFFGLAGKGIT
jgi:hypothetical protein